MSSKVLISIVAVAFLVTQVLPQSQGVPLNSPQQQQPQHPLASGGVLSNARKINLMNMNPGIIKLYRLLGGGISIDDDGSLSGGDESYFQKRQQYDDYGHMRFGKRNPKDFDDYGHMRFGKK